MQSVPRQSLPLKKRKLSMPSQKQQVSYTLPIKKRRPQPSQNIRLSSSPSTLRFSQAVATTTARSSSPSSRSLKKRNDKRKMTSIYPGVSKKKDRDVWFSRITFRGENIHLGTFKNPEQAYKKYIIAKNRKEKGLHPLD